MLRSLVAGSIAFVTAFAATPARADGQTPRGPSPGEVPAEVGLHGGSPYLRAFDDRLRLYPDLALRLDGTWSQRPDVNDAGLGADRAGTRLVLRRVLFGLSGEIVRRVAFTAQVEMGGQRIGETPVSFPASRLRWAPADAHDGVLRPAEVSISATPWKALNLTVGQVATPMSLSNRTPEAAGTFLERPLPIRGLVAPNERALGVMAWGELDDRAFAYEAGVFGGQLGRPIASGDVDLVGRAFVRPFARLGRGVFFELAQIGVSARLGTRTLPGSGADLTSVMTPSNLATGQGFVLFRPTITDAAGRAMVAMPNGAQRAIGGELRLPFRTPTKAVFDLEGEAYVVRDELGAATDTTRIGPSRARIYGAAWYVKLDWWACFIPGFDQLVTGEPGMTRPKSLDDARIPAPKSALEASILVGGINASYDGLRGAAGQGAPRDVTLYQLGGALQYLLGTNVRASFEYMAYVAPHAGDASITSVVVPSNLGAPAVAGHVAHELGLRIGAGL